MYGCRQEAIVIQVFLALGTQDVLLESNHNLAWFTFDLEVQSCGHTSLECQHWYSLHLSSYVDVHLQACTKSQPQEHNEEHDERQGNKG